MLDLAWKKRDLRPPRISLTLRVIAGSSCRLAFSAEEEEGGVVDEPNAGNEAEDEDETEAEAEAEAEAGAEGEAEAEDSAKGEGDGAEEDELPSL